MSFLPHPVKIGDRFPIRLFHNELHKLKGGTVSFRAGWPVTKLKHIGSTSLKHSIIGDRISPVQTYAL
jgi:hypothetical protein